MSDPNDLLAFGPVPSRRLGQSVGINNIPPKHCSLSCIYCQLGRTNSLSVNRQVFYEPALLVGAVEARLVEAQRRGLTVDFLTYVADGEPTLDLNLGREVALLQPLGVKLAVISNATLLWRGDVRDDLARADLVSLKVDAADEQTWRRVNRPHGSLRLAKVQQGMLAFAAGYTGTLITETMLVRGVNDSVEQVSAVAAFLQQLAPACSYLAAPIRPPAERSSRAPEQATIDRAFMILNASVPNVDTLTGNETGSFGSSGSAETDLLSITAVHPMRKEAVAALLQRTGSAWSVVQDLIDQGKLVEHRYNETSYYIRRLSSCKSS